MFFIDSQGNLYQGDMRPGDREATQQEIEAWELANLPTAEEDIAAKLQEFGLTQEWLLHSHMAGALAYATSLGLSEAQAYAANPAYRKAKDAVAWIAARRAQG